MVSKSFSLLVTWFVMLSSGWAQDAKRDFADLRSDFLAFSQRAAIAATPIELASAAIDLALLRQQIIQRGDFDSSPALRQLSRQIEGRLDEIIRRQLAMARRGTSRSSNSQLPDGRAEAIQSHDAVTPQPSVSSELRLASLAADHLTLASWMHGGPDRVVHYAGGYFGGLLQSNAQDLIDLIQSMIHSDSWDVHGGASTIRYYSPGLALVVRTTTVGHEDLTSFLRQLRGTMW